jgi:hypothetical protein
MVMLILVFGRFELRISTCFGPSLLGCLVVSSRFHRRLQFPITITVLLLSSEPCMSSHCTVTTLRTVIAASSTEHPLTHNSGDIIHHRLLRDCNLEPSSDMWITYCVLKACVHVSG